MSNTYLQDIYTTTLSVFKQRDITTPDKPDAALASHIVQAVGARHLGFNPLMIEDLDRQLTLALEPGNKSSWSGNTVVQNIDAVSSALNQAAERTQPEPLKLPAASSVKARPLSVVKP